MLAVREREQGMHRRTAVPQEDRVQLRQYRQDTELPVAYSAENTGGAKRGYGNPDTNTTTAAATMSNATRRSTNDAPFASRERPAFTTTPTSPGGAPSFAPAPRAVGSVSSSLNSTSGIPYELTKELRNTKLRIKPWSLFSYFVHRSYVRIVSIPLSRLSSTRQIVILTP